MAGNGFPNTLVGKTYSDFPPFFQEWLANQEILPYEEQLDLLAKYEETGDIKYRNEFLLQYARLIAKICFHFRNKGVPKEDLFQEGFLALYKGYEKFDTDRGVKFGTYTANWMKQYMQKLIFEQARSVQLPSYLHGALVIVYRAEIRLFQKGVAEPTDQEIIEEVGEEEELWKIRRALEYRGPLVLSLEHPQLNSRDSFDESLTLRDILSDSSFENDPETRILAKEQLDLHCHKIKEILRKVETLRSKRNIFMFKLRYGLDGSLEMNTFQMVADFFEVSRQRVEQVIKKILTRFKLIIIDPTTNKKIDKFEEEIETVKRLRELVDLNEDIWTYIYRAIFNHEG